jgi:DNA-binding NarL/FixJ family response regulator
MMGWDDPIRILLATANARISSKLEKLLASAGEELELTGVATNTTEILIAAERQPFDVLICDLDLTGFAPIIPLRAFEISGRSVQLVEICDPRSPDSRFTALKISVALFHERPFSRSDFLSTVRTARGE